jgi:hypothetical protein
MPWPDLIRPSIALEWNPASPGTKTRFALLPGGDRKSTQKKSPAFRQGLLHSRLSTLACELAVLSGILHWLFTLAAARILLLLTGLLAATLLLLARLLVLLARILVLVAHVGKLPC